MQSLNMHVDGLWTNDFFLVFSFYQINQIIEYKLKTNNTGTIENTVYILYKCLHLGSKNSKAIIRIYFVIWPYWLVICRPLCSKKKKFHWLHYEYDAIDKKYVPHLIILITFI